MVTCERLTALVLPILTQGFSIRLEDTDKFWHVFGIDEPVRSFLMMADVLCSIYRRSESPVRAARESRAGRSGRRTRIKYCQTVYSHVTVTS
jgi:hypothetical protein